MRKALKRAAILAIVALCAIAAFTIVHAAVSEKFADLGTDRYFPLSFLGFVVVGAYSIVRRPEQRIGWVMAGIGLSISLAVIGGSYVLPLVPESWRSWVALASQPMFILGFGALVPLFFLWYPTGFVPSPRWRRLEQSIIALPLFLAGYYVLRPGPTMEWESGLENPIGLDNLAPLRDSPIEMAIGLGLLVLALCSVASQYVRYSSGTWEVRQQIRLVLYPTLLLMVLFLLFAFPLASRFPTPNDLVPFALVVGMNGIAIGVGVAIARYRLFEVDRFVARTVSYTVVVGLLALVFALGVVWIPTALGLDDSPLLVAAATLAVAALFSPLRRWVQSVVDRRFNRARYDAERVISSFAGSLRDEVEVEQVVSGWERVVSETMQPATIGVWVRVS